MKNDNSTSDKTKGGKKKIIKLVALGAILVTIFLAFFLPYTVSDGVERFSGKEAEAARYATRNGYDHSPAGPIPDIMPAFKASVMEVYKNPLDKKCGQGSGLVYIVDVAKVTFFGIEQPGYETWVCIE